MGIIKKIIKLGTIGSEILDAKHELENLTQKRTVGEQKDTHNSDSSNQIKAIIDYQKATISSVENVVYTQKQEVERLISQFNHLYTSEQKLSRKENNEYLSQKEQIENKLRYLYLIKDYFSLANKFTNGYALTSSQQNLILKFYPFFEGKPVLDELYVDEDGNQSMTTSLIGGGNITNNNRFIDRYNKAIQDVTERYNRTIKYTMVKYNNMLNDATQGLIPGAFSFDNYIEPYKELISNLCMPDIDVHFNIFKSQCIASSNPSRSVNTVVNNNIFTCQSCGREIQEGAKFCPYCGNKVEEQNFSFCPQCGSKILPGTKFCSSCGFKINPN